MSDSLVTPWTAARQAPLSMGFPRQEYWSRLPFPSPGNLLDPRTEPASPALASGYFTIEPLGSLLDLHREALAESKVSQAGHGELKKCLKKNHSD